MTPWNGGVSSMNVITVLPDPELEPELAPEPQPADSVTTPSAKSAPTMVTRCFMLYPQGSSWSWSARVSSPLVLCQHRCVKLTM